MLWKLKKEQVEFLKSVNEFDITLEAGIDLYSVYAYTNIGNWFLNVYIKEEMIELI